MIAAIRTMQQDLGRPVCSSIDDQAIGQQVVVLQKYLSTVADPSQASGFRFNPALVQSNIADTALPEAIVALQNISFDLAPGIIGTKFGPNGGGSGTGVAGDATHASATSRSRIDMPNYDQILKWVEYWNGRINFAGNGEVVGPNNINVKAAVEIAGVTTPLYAADRVTRTMALAGGARQKFYATGQIILPAGSLPFARQYVSVIANDTWPVNRICHNTTLGESENTFGTGAGSDQCDAVGTFGSATSAYGFTPCSVVGIPADRIRRKRIGLLQDSLGTVAGVDASPGYGDANGYAGHWERAIGSQIATINAARATGRLQWVAAGFDNQLAMMGPYISSVIIELGRNDISNGRTLLQMQTDYATVATAFRNMGVAVFAQTITPKPLTTADGGLDGGSSISAPQEVIRQGYNTWLKTLPVGTTYCFDIAAAVEDPARPGYFKPNNPAYSSDLTHLLQSGMDAAVAACDISRLI